MTTGRLLSAALMGLVGMGSVFPITAAEKAPIPARTPATRPSRKAILSGSHYSGVIRFGYLKNPTGTVAQNKRASIKAKNRAKHRAHMKGRA